MLLDGTKPERKSNKWKLLLPLVLLTALTLFGGGLRIGEAQDREPATASRNDTATQSRALEEIAATNESNILAGTPAQEPAVISPQDIEGTYVQRVLMESQVAGRLTFRITHKEGNAFQIVLSHPGNGEVRGILTLKENELVLSDLETFVDGMWEEMPPPPRWGEERLRILGYDSQGRFRLEWYRVGQYREDGELLTTIFHKVDRLPSIPGTALRSVPGSSADEPMVRVYDLASLNLGTGNEVVHVITNIGSMIAPEVRFIIDLHGNRLTIVGGGADHEKMVDFLHQLQHPQALPVRAHETVTIVPPTTPVSLNELAIRLQHAVQDLTELERTVLDPTTDSRVGAMRREIQILEAHIASAQNAATLHPPPPIVQQPVQLLPYVPPTPRQAGGMRRPTMAYVIEPPDILSIEAVNLIPKSPYRLRVFDIVEVQVLGTPLTDPIAGMFTIEPGGVIILGGVYGSVNIAGLTTEQARDAIRTHLTQERSGQLTNPTVTVRLVRMGDMQKIVGTHTVGPDGFITLGSYGRVYVSGLTVQEAKDAVEYHLSRFLDEPQVVVEVLAMNSKRYYIIMRWADRNEQQIITFPWTGNDTVMSALAELTVMKTDRIDIKHIRPGNDEPTITPLQWDRVLVSRSGTGDNLQLLPDDRLMLELKAEE